MKKMIFNKKDYYVLLVLTFIYCFTRIVNILQIPVFVDEGNYIIWAKQLLTQGAYFITLTDGKPPLPTWGVASFIYFTPQNMLLGLRLFSVFIGYVATVGFFLLSYILFGKRTAFIGTLLYIFTPFILFYDRIGLVDSFANATSIFILISSVILIKKRTILSSILFGVLAGIGLLVKSNSWLYIYFSTLAPLLIFQRRNLKKSIQDSLRFIVLYALGIMISQLIFRIQLFAPYPDPLKLVSNKNADFLYPISELLNNPIGLFINNVPSRIMDFAQMTGWSIFIFGNISYIYLFFKKRALSLYLSLWFFVPLIIIPFLVKFFFLRYMISLIPLLILPLGYMIENIRNTYLKYAIIIVILLSFIYYDLPLLINYQQIHFPMSERNQYVEGIASGYGIKEIVLFAQQNSKKQPVIILGEGIFGLGSYIVESAVPMYEKNIQVIGLWPFDKTALQSYQPQLKTKKIYVVMHGQAIKNVPSSWPLKLVKEYKKPYNTAYFRLYELIK